MLCQFLDGEFVPDVVDEAVSYLLQCARLLDSIVIPATTAVGFPQEAMPAILCHHAIWIVHEGEDFFLIEIDVSQMSLMVWSTHARPAVVHWIRCVLEAMMPVNSRIHSGWWVLMEHHFPKVGVTSAMSVLMTNLYRHLMRVPEIPSPDVTTAGYVMLRIFGHFADLFA